MGLKEFLKNIPAEEIEKQNKLQIKENDEIYKDFKNAYSQNCCSLCGNKLDYFNKAESCFHWFLMPSGIRKKDFNNFLKEPIGYFKLESYFRWIATMEIPFVNINDLSDEISKSKIKEITIKYKNIEWSLNFGPNELTGHLDSKNANFPHFHLQMLINDRPYISFNDYHIPFSKEDLFNLELMKQEENLVSFRNVYGEGLSFMENNEHLLELDKILKVADDENSATFHTSSIIEMPNGKSMSGEILLEIFNKSKETKIPVRHLIGEFYKEAKITTLISPGNGVPEMKKRK